MLFARFYSATASPPGDYLLLRLRFLGLAWLLVVGVCRAADPQAYQVELQKTGQAQLDKLLEDASTLISLQKTAEVGPFALIARAKQDQQRFVTALQSLGYYQGRVSVKIAEHDVDDAELFTWLNAAVDSIAPVKVSFELGPLFQLGQINIQGDAPAGLRDSLALKTSDPAIAENVLAARQTLLQTLLEQGYALAKVAEPVASLNAQQHSIDLLIQVDCGDKLDLGEISWRGLKQVHLAFLQNRLLIGSGQAFKASEIEAARKDQADLGVFASVNTHLDNQVDQQGRLPLSFEVLERPAHAVNVGAAYSTDLGGSLSSAWLHRNLLGNAEQLNVTAAVTQLGGNSTTGIGYKAGVAFSKPDFMARDETLQLGVNAIQQSLIAYDETSLLANMRLSRKFARQWQLGYGVALKQAQITQESLIRNYTLLSLPVSLKYDSSNNPLDPSAGSIFNVALTPTQALAGSNSQPFVLLQTSASTYLDLAEPGRSILALRGLIGDSGGASQFDLPPDQRFYAGGSATVRGYKYQSVGPRFADSKPQGGTAIAAGSVEFRQRVLDDYGLVAFADIGQVSVNALPFSNRWQIGAGVGARYYTGFGPIRLDVALPVNPQPGSGAFELYIGLGQAF